MRSSGADASANRREHRWALVRVGLGGAQMIGASVSFLLLIETGITPWSLGAAVATCVLTTVSVLLFGDRRRRR